MTNPLANARGIGDNAPPVDDTFPGHAERVAALIDSANTWANTLKEITDEDTAKACTDFIDQLRAEWQTVEARRKVLRKPYQDELDKIQEAYVPLLNKLELAASVAKKLKGTWLSFLESRQKAEAARKAEEAAKAIAEAEAAEKRAKTGTGDVVGNLMAASEATARAEQIMQEAAEAENAKPTVKGNYSAKSSGYRTTWKAEIREYQLALAHYGSHPKVRELIQQLADNEARTMKKATRIPGIVAVETRSVA